MIAFEAGVLTSLKNGSMAYRDLMPSLTKKVTGVPRIVSNTLSAAQGGGANRGCVRGGELTQNKEERGEDPEERRCLVSAGNCRVGCLVSHTIDAQ